MGGEHNASGSRAAGVRPPRAHPRRPAGERPLPSVYSMHMVAHIHDCIIVGAGQAGLSTAFYLQRRGITP